MKLKNIDIKKVFFILFTFYFFLRINEISDWNLGYDNNYSKRLLLIFLVLSIAIISFFLKLFEKKDAIFLYPIILFFFSGQYNYALSLLLLVFLSKEFNNFLEYYRNNKFKNIISLALVFLVIFYPLIKNYDHSTIFFNTYWSATRFGLGYNHPKEQALALFFLFLVLIEMHKDFRIFYYIIFFILIFITNSRNITLVFLIYTTLTLYTSLNRKDKDLVIKFIKFCAFPIVTIFLFLNLEIINYENINSLSSHRLDIIKLIFREELPYNFSTDNSYLLFARENILFFYLLVPWIIFIIFKFELFYYNKLNEFKILIICLFFYSFFDLGLFSSTNLLSLMSYSKYYK